MTRQETEDRLARQESGLHAVAEAAGEAYRRRDELSDDDLLAVTECLEEFEQDVIRFIGKLEAITRTL